MRLSALAPLLSTCALLYAQSGPTSTWRVEGLVSRSHRKSLFERTDSACIVGRRTPASGATATTALALLTIAAGKEGRSTPILRPVPDKENFNNLVGVSVYDDVGRTNQLVSALDLAGTAKSGKACHLRDAVEHRLSHAAGSIGIVLLNVPNSGFELIGRFGCPPNAPHR